VPTFFMCLYSLKRTFGSVCCPNLGRDGEGLNGESLGDLAGDLEADLSRAVKAGVWYFPLMIFLNRSFSFDALNGCDPNKIVYKRIPVAHISVAGPEYFSLLQISGDM